MILKQILHQTYKKFKLLNLKSANLDAEILLCHALKKPKEWLYANSNKSISKKNYNKFQKLVLRRSKFEPITYIVGKKEFYGLDFFVDKNVLIPRPETEIIIDEILKLEQYNSILDIGTGSGCIAITLAKQLTNNNQQLIIYATDISQRSLKIAKKNTKKHKLTSNIKFIKSDLFKKIPKKLKFDIITANLPYLDSKTINQNPELKYEPIIALKAENNGIKLYKLFFKQVSKYLKNNSKIFIEIGDGQFPKIKKIIKKELPYSKIRTKKDLNQKIRVLIVDIQSK